ncbi:hypothetical protein [uncultured Aquimarina sp.]|uniref:hypothetical protein n=1 Tax=uncultured Aquimarina sp. TaxID=575652 RepID=UPI00260C2176|nr:hypothetical protein [uncultured Aquimarina sp.]
MLYSYIDANKSTMVACATLIPIITLVYEEDGSQDELLQRGVGKFVSNEFA